jgi:hypothetical protein
MANGLVEMIYISLLLFYQYIYDSVSGWQTAGPERASEFSPGPAGIFYSQKMDEDVLWGRGGGWTCTGRKVE